MFTLAIRFDRPSKKNGHALSDFFSGVPCHRGMMSDAELIRRWAGDRDEAAFRALVERYAGLVHGVAWRRTGGDRLLAEEVVQNVFALLARKAERLAGHPAPGAWLHRAAVLECSHARRRETIRRRHLDALAEHTALMSDDPSTAWPAAAAEPELDKALTALSASDRHILLLRFFEGKSFREIGAALGKNESAAQRQSARALERLAAQLRRRGVAVPATVLAGGLAISLAHSAPAGLAATVVPSALATGGSLTAAQLLTHTLAMTVHGKNLLSTAAAILLVLACLGGSFLLGRQQARAADFKASSRDTAALTASAGPPPPPVPYATSEATTRLRSRKPPLREMLQRIADLHLSPWNNPIQNLIDSLLALGQLEPGDLPAALELLPEFKAEPHRHYALASVLFPMLAAQSPREAAKAMEDPEAMRDGKMPSDAFQEVVGIWLDQEPDAAWTWGLEQIREDRLWSLDPPTQEPPVLLAAAWLKGAPATVLPRLTEMDSSAEGDAFIRKVMAYAMQPEGSPERLLTYLTSLPDDHFRQLMLETGARHKSIIPWIAAQSWEGPEGLPQAFRTYLGSGINRIPTFCQGLPDIPAGPGQTAAIDALQAAMEGIDDPGMIEGLLNNINDTSLRERVAQGVSQ